MQKNYMWKTYIWVEEETVPESKQNKFHHSNHKSVAERTVSSERAPLRYIIGE